MLNTYKKQLTFVLKALIWLLAWQFLYHKIQQDAHFWQDLQTALLQLDALTTTSSLLAVGALMCLNWGFESRKWQILLRPIEPIRFRVAFAQVLRGLATALSIPTQVGVFAGRTLHFTPQKRIQSVGALLLGSQAQSYLTFGTGSIALLIFLYESVSTRFFIFMLLIVIALQGLALLYFMGYKTLLFWLRRYPKIYKALRVLRYYSKGELFLLLLFSALRYVVFCFQFLVLLRLFAIELPIFDALIGISLVFATKSLLPTFHVLSDLGLRESAALFFFAHYGTPHAPLILASLLLWAMNVMFPSVAGLLLWFVSPAPLDKAHIQNS
ncbi:MAG: flippase-like domain-containing protein [Bernardetiaceae bacterium]|nr:flippase-like domain-containing protein [Bernardetiaceae bacterium]